MKKRNILTLIITSFMAVCLMIPSVNLTMVSAEDPDITTTAPTTPAETLPPEGNPEFIFKSEQYFTVGAGKTTTLGIRIDNISKYSSKMTTVNIKDDKSVFKFDSPTSFTERGIPTNVGRTFYFDLNVPKTLEAGRYPLTLDITNVNYDYGSSKQSLTFYIDVVNSLDISGIYVSDYSVDKKDVKSGDAFNINATLKNTSGVDISDIKVQLEGLDGTKFAMNSGLSSATVNIKNGEETKVSFPVVACAGLSSIREVIPMKISYYINPNNKESKQETATNITVSCSKTASADGKTFAPNIIIDSYSFGGDYVVGGKAFPLSLKIRNASKTSSIENLKVTIQGASGNKDGGVAFSPANSSNSFFFEKLGAGVSTDIKLDILPKADAKPDSYPLQVIFSYEYTADGKKDKADSVTETITIPLQQDDRFTANEVQISSDSVVGQECPISVSFINKGKSSIYNVSVDVEGEGFDKTSSAYYIGNIDTGKEELYDTVILPNTEGQIKGEIVVTYEDSNGKEKELRKEFMTNAMAMTFEPMPGGDMMNGEMPVDGPVKNQGLPVWAVIAICAGGAVIVIVGIIITVKIIKKKKAAKAEKEDDDEDI